MPRESYRTDDEDDDLRRGAASGGGIPGWVWVLGGGGVLAAVVVVGLGFFAFTSHRQVAARQEFVRADAAAARMKVTEPQVDKDEAGDARPELPELSVTRIANSYKNNPAEARVRYTRQHLRVRFEVKVVGEGWAGTAADLGAGLPRATVPNVIFRFTGATPAAGETVVILGECVGLNPDPLVGQTLIFTNCRVVEE